jgi:hypothetical protein
LRRTQLGLPGFQRGALGNDVRPILLGCVQCFFEGDVVTVEEAPDRTDAGLLGMSTLKPLWWQMVCRLPIHRCQAP